MIVYILWNIIVISTTFSKNINSIKMEGMERTWKNFREPKVVLKKKKMDQDLSDRTQIT